MIKSLYLNNFMLFDEIEFNDFARINLFIGENDTGKTSVLKVLYSIASGIEDYSDNVRIKYTALGYSPGIELVLKLPGSFSTSEKDLIKTNNDHFSIKCNVENSDKIEDILLKFQLKPDLKNYEYEHKPPRMVYDFNTIFIPPKEILSIKNAINLSSGKLNDFDDTYIDLVKSIETPINIEDSNRLDVFRNHKKYDWYDGQVQIIEENGGKRPVFIKNNIKFEIHNVAEGIKKLGIFPVLESFGHLTKKTILFIDEPENSVHPKALRELMRFFYDISKEGVQIFMASHNQFVVQQLRNIAKINNYSINCYSLLKEKDSIQCKLFDLKYKLAENPIIDEALKMFDESVLNG